MRKTKKELRVENNEQAKELYDETIRYETVADTSGDDGSVFVTGTTFDPQPNKDIKWHTTSTADE